MSSGRVRVQPGSCWKLRCKVVCGERLLESAVGGVGIVDRDLANELWRKTVRDDVLAIEMPMRIVGREQQDFIRPEMVEDPLDNRRIRWSVERLQRQPHPLADDFAR